MQYTKQNSAASEELVQAVFIRIWEKRKKLKDVKSPGDYVFILARNLILDWLRAEARNGALQKAAYGMQPDNRNDTDHSLLTKEYSKILQNAIDRLPPQQKRVFIMAKQEGMAHSEIAEKLSLATSTVHTTVKLGLRSVQRYVDQHLVGILIFCLFIF